MGKSYEEQCKEANKDDFGKVLEVLFGIFCVFLSVSVQLWSAHMLWGWFVVPLGVPLPGYKELYGMCLLVNVLGYDSANYVKKEKSIGMIFAASLSPLVAVAIGYAVKFWL